MFSNMFRHLQPLTLTILLSKKPPFDKTTSSNEKTDVSFTEKQAPKVTGIFDENHELLTPSKKCRFFDRSKMTLLSSKKTHFEKTTISDNKTQVSFAEKKCSKEVWNIILDQNNLLTSLEKCKFFDFSKMTFMSSKKPPFGKTTSSDDKKEISNTEKQAGKSRLEFLTRIMG